MRKALAIGAALASAVAGLGIAAVAPASAATPTLQVTTVWGVVVVADNANTGNTVDVMWYGSGSVLVSSNQDMALSGGCVSATPKGGFLRGAACPTIAKAAIVLLNGGNDVFTGDFQGRLEVHGGDGADSLSAGPASYDAYLYGENGNDTLRSRNKSTLDGGENDDVIDAAVAAHLGISGKNTIFGGGGHDVITAGGAPDTVDGGAGPDTIKGGDGDDEIVGGTGSDTIKGGAGLDTIYAASKTTTVDTEFDDVDCGGGARDKARTGTSPKDKRASCEQSL